MTQDLHSHTYFSACGADDPELLILKAIESGIDVFGISDHNYGIGDKKRRYFSLLTELQQKYSGKIRLFRGIEIATVNGLCLGAGRGYFLFRLLPCRTYRPAGQLCRRGKYYIVFQALRLSYGDRTYGSVFLSGTQGIRSGSIFCRAGGKRNFLGDERQLRFCSRLQGASVRSDLSEQQGAAEACEKRRRLPQRRI